MSVTQPQAIHLQYLHYPNYKTTDDNSFAPCLNLQPRQNHPWERDQSDVGEDVEDVDVRPERNEVDALPSDEGPAVR